MKTMKKVLFVLLVALMLFAGCEITIDGDKSGGGGNSNGANNGSNNGNSNGANNGGNSDGNGNGNGNGNSNNGTVIITGNTIVGQQLSANVSDLNGITENYSYVWRRGDTPTNMYTVISDANMYFLTTDDISKFITVTVSCSDPYGSWTSAAVGPVTISSEIPDLSASLREKLAWISYYAESNETYTLAVTSDESLDPQTLSYSGKDNITIILKGENGEKTISLSSNGSLFSIGYGVTLILDNNITLQGMDDNTASLITVTGSLVMNEGAKISGNTVTGKIGAKGKDGGRYNNGNGAKGGNGGNGYGGGVYVGGGTFTMNGGEISNNSARGGDGGKGGEGGDGRDFSNYGGDGGDGGDGGNGYGGGVYVGSGTFIMNDGIISNNTVLCGSGGWSGARGGVWSAAGFVSYNSQYSGGYGNLGRSGNGYGSDVYVNGTFTRNGGVISNYYYNGNNYSFITLNSVTADGSPTQTTTELTLTFDGEISGLTANDIILSGVNVSKGTLSGYNPYTLPISINSISGGTLNVDVSKSGYIINGSPKTVDIYYYYHKQVFEMVQIPGGSFEMGDVKGEGYSYEKPVHTVTLSSFYMGKYEVTQEQWTVVMGSNPSYFKQDLPASGEVQNRRPVEQVSWYNTLVFCNKLSMLEGLSPAYRISGSTDPAVWGTVPNPYWDAVEIVAGSNGYRLPTEAQWEYAAKGGNGSPGNYTYSGSNDVDSVGWYESNSGSKTHEVGKKAPNSLGLYDMSGNVCEWCWDWYGNYSFSWQNDPVGPVSGTSRVYRGGYWRSAATDLRSAGRDNYGPYGRSYAIGLRIVRPCE